MTDNVPKQLRQEALAVDVWLPYIIQQQPNYTASNGIMHDARCAPGEPAGSGWLPLLTCLQTGNGSQGLLRALL